jgi:hypothetical protein
MDTDEYIHKELSEDIVGAAMTVLNKLRPGLKQKAGSALSADASVPICAICGSSS